MSTYLSENTIIIKYDQINLQSPPVGTYHISRCLHDKYGVSDELNPRKRQFGENVAFNTKIMMSLIIMSN